MDKSVNGARRADLRLLGLIAFAITLAACGGDDDPPSSSTPPPAPMYSIGGSVAGLASGEQLRLMNNSADALTLTADGDFRFATRIAQNGSYAITVDSQPAGKTCSVAGSTGSGLSADVSSVNVTCSVDTYTIGGSVAGLSDGATLTLLQNGGDSLAVSDNGSFTFATPVAHSGSYAVTIGTQPVGQTCSLSGGTGSGDGVIANITAVNITCSIDSYTIGGSVAGLANGAQVTLLDNGGDSLTVTGDGAFTFAEAVAYNGSYSVTVGTQPIGQTCSVANGTGAGVAVSANVTTVDVTCSANVYSIGGSVTGLINGAQLTLRNNGGDPLIVTADGSFEFPTQVAFAGSYLVTVSAQPAGHTCMVSSGSGANVAANVITVQVACSVLSQYAYVLQNADTIAQYSLDAQGMLTANTPDSIAAGIFPRAMSIDPANQYAYVANMGGTIYAYTIGAGGVLAANGSVTVGGNPVDVVVDRTGRYVYLAYDSSNTVSQFIIGTDGTLTPNGSIALGAGGMLRTMVAHPTADFVYVLNQTGDIAMLSIDAGGVLSSLGTAPTQAFSRGMVIDPTGKYFYVANSAANTVSLLTIGNDGLLTPHSTAPTGNLPNYIAGDPSGRYVYVVNSNSNDISQYAIGNDGSLSALAAPLANTHDPGAINIERSGTYAYITNQADGTISQYTIGTDGSLTLFHEFVASPGGHATIVTTH